jgi:hypothetical protein
MKCETSDCSSCKKKSKEYDEGLSAQGQEQRDAANAVTRAEVDAAAKAATENAKQELVREAGRRKSDATRKVGLKAHDRTLEAKRKAQDALQAAQEAFEKAALKANTLLDDTLSAIRLEQKIEQDAVEATDWTSQVASEVDAEKESKGKGKKTAARV